jgi:uncharacterized damage-inducible protein DinB
MAGAMTLTEAASLIDVTWKAWIAAIEAVPEDRWSEAGVCGAWSIKDLVGHISVWDQVCVDYLGERARGEEREAIDWQRVNDEAAASRADRSIAQQRAEMDESHQALLGALSTKTSFDPEVLGESSWLHYDEHAAQVWAWR